MSMGSSICSFALPMALASINQYCSLDVTFSIVSKKCNYSLNRTVKNMVIFSAVATVVSSAVSLYAASYIKGVLPICGAVAGVALGSYRFYKEILSDTPLSVLELTALISGCCIYEKALLDHA